MQAIIIKVSELRALPTTLEILLSPDEFLPLLDHKWVDLYIGKTASISAVAAIVDKEGIFPCYATQAADPCTPDAIYYKLQ